MQDTVIRQNLDLILALFLSMTSLVLAIYWIGTHPPVKYDCSLAETNPDYPIAAKEECRKLRAENVLNKPK